MSHFAALAQTAQTTAPEDEDDVLMITHVLPAAHKRQSSSGQATRASQAVDDDQVVTHSLPVVHQETFLSSISVLSPMPCSPARLGLVLVFWFLPSSILFLFQPLLVFCEGEGGLSYLTHVSPSLFPHSSALSFINAGIK